MREVDRERNELRDVTLEGDEEHRRMTETVHYPDGSRIMRGYANPGNDGSNPEFAEDWVS